MLISALFVFGLTAFFLLRDGYQSADGVILALLGAGLIGGWLLLRPRPGIADELAQFQAKMGQGQAVLLEMQSPF